MPAPIETRIAEHLAHAIPDPIVLRSVQPLAGGACQDNYRVDLEIGGEPRRMVLRSDAKRSLPSSLNRAAEFEVIRAAVAAGVRTPAARWPARDLLREGSAAYFLDWVDGVAVGRQVLRNEELKQARAKLPAELASELAKIHSITPASAPNLTAALGPPIDPVERVLTTIRRSFDGLVEPRPALEWIFRWLTEHPPRSRERVLVHGDFRTGNFMVTEQGLSGVLDWEFARWGDPAEDIAWLCLRDWRFGQVDRPVGGFGQRADFLALYESASGRTVDPNDVRYWEIMGNVWWAGGAAHQSERYLSGGEPDLELLAIGPRAVEMEYEAIRLIEDAGRR
jgi:aminoglycoside phosphotransferase (APT) family kinase protein